MRLTQGLAAVVLMASAAVAHAELTGTVTAVSDYDFRGISQTAKGPALQGSIDWASDFGLYVGAWASNVDFDDCCDESVEVDLYAGFAGGEDFTYDVGLVWYAYPGAEYANGRSIDYGEIYGALGYKWIEGKIWYSPDFANADESAMYYEANGTFELPANFGFTAHVGYSDGSYWDEFYDGGYTDWSVGLTYTVGHLDLGLKYVDGSDLADLDDFCRDFDCSGLDKDTFSTDAKVVFQSGQCSATIHTEALRKNPLVVAWVFCVDAPGFVCSTAIAAYAYPCFLVRNGVSPSFSLKTCAARILFYFACPQKSDPSLSLRPSNCILSF